jgi:hypothetical protein
MTVTLKDFVDWSTAGMVFVCGALSGHYAAEGMTAVQWAGALCAVLGSVTVAVAVRVWPEPEPFRSEQQD